MMKRPEVSETHEVLDDRKLFDQARRDRRGFLNEERLRAEIASAGAEATIASSQANVIYASETYLPVDVVPTFVLVTGSGDRAVVINEADTALLRAYTPDIEDVRSYRFGPNSERDAIDLLAETINDFGLGHAAIGAESAQMSSARMHTLIEACPDVRWLDAGTIFERTRLIKTEQEREVLAAAARMTVQAINDGFREMAEGTTEKELAARIQGSALMGGGEELSHGQVMAGLNSTLGHAISLETPVRVGDVIHVDFGAKFAGYCSDISRNASLGKLTPKQESIYERLLDIHLRLLDWLRPGVAASEVFMWNERAFEAAGLTYPWGTIGHGIGLMMHEGFEMSVGSDIVLEPGMVVCVEPSHIEPGDARYDLEDMVAILDDGVEVLSTGDDIAPMFEVPVGR